MDNEILTVAKFWKTNPDLVENWKYTDFLNRQEYMNLYLEISRPKTGSDTDAGVPWTGPNNG